MARPMREDFLGSMRFQVSATLAGGGPDPLQPAGAQAGFSACTMPELSQEGVEYREGNYIYTKKFPGVPSIGGDLTLSRGVSRRDTAFYNWMLTVVEGGPPGTQVAGEYRADLEIKHYHRDVAVAPGSDLIPVKATPTKTVNILHAFPSRFKPGADFEATSGDVSIMELDVAFEQFKIVEAPPAP